MIQNHGTNCVVTLVNEKGEAVTPKMLSMTADGLIMRESYPFEPFRMCEPHEVPPLRRATPAERRWWKRRERRR